jgi:hypothetical protein
VCVCVLLCLCARNKINENGTTKTNKQTNTSNLLLSYTHLKLRHSTSVIAHVMILIFCAMCDDDIVRICVEIQIKATSMLRLASVCTNVCDVCVCERWLLVLLMRERCVCNIVCVSVCACK